MNIIKEKGMYIMFVAVVFGITALGAWSTEKMENVSVEIDPEYVYNNLY